MAILRRRGSPVKDAGNVVCIAMAAAVVALACYETLRCAERALVAGRAFALLHTRSWDGRIGGGAAMATDLKV